MPPIAQIPWLATWLVHPGLLLAGAALVAVPILIHLLNRRKFRIVDWAAMEFLLDADKKNRRRIRLENLLLLLLRCLAVLLLGLLLARPFLPAAATAGLVDAARFERIVVLDDSLSMQTRLGNTTAFELARKRLLDLTAQCAQQTADNSLTLLVTSQPDRRLLTAAPLSTQTLDDLQATVNRLAPGDGTAQLGESLAALERYLRGQPQNVNRVVYLLSDLRRRDWFPEASVAGGRASDAAGRPQTAAGEKTAAAASGALTPLARLAEVAQHAQGCYLIDVGDDDDRNLTVGEVRAEGTLVLGVQSAFDVLVTNHGSSEARDLQVKFTAGEALPLEAPIERLGAGETAAVRFQFTFAAGDEDEASASPPPWRVKIEVAGPSEGDRLAADSTAYFPARLVRGIPVLLVDGDPSAEFGRAESFYLQRALAPRGPVPSGVAAEVVSESEFDPASLDAYQVIFLLNTFRLGEQTQAAVGRLEQWVARGGGLVLLPGDQIDEPSFNAQWWREGAGLAPLGLAGIAGDDTETRWVQLRVADANHPVFQPFAGQDNPLLDSVKIFRWWQAHPPAASVQTPASPAGPPGHGAQLSERSIIARLSDDDQSPTIAEGTWGEGRVVLFTLPADADWHTWTSDPSYLLVMQDLVRYLAGGRRASGLVRVGEPLVHPLDLTTYALDVALAGPHDLKAHLQAAAPSESEAAATEWQVRSPPAMAQGFYELTLERREGGRESVLFAANVDPSEGNLARADRRRLERELAGSGVQILAAEAELLADRGAQSEIWRHVLWVVAAVLTSEQLLGWFLGRRRS